MTSSSRTQTSNSYSNLFNQITNGTRRKYKPQSFHQSHDDDFLEQHLQPSKFPNLSSRNLADVPKDITVESSLDSSRFTIHSSANSSSGVKTRKGKAKEASGGLSRSTSLTTTNGFLSDGDDSEEDGGYQVDLKSIARVNEEREEEDRQDEVRDRKKVIEDKGVGSSTSKRKDTPSQETVRDLKKSNAREESAAKDPFSDEQQEKKDPLSSRAFSPSSSHPPQSYKEAKQKAGGMMGSVRGSNVSLGKKGGAQAIDGYLNLSVSRHGLIRTFALPPSSINSLSYSSLVHLLEIDVPWEKSRWAQLPLGDGKRAEKEPGKSAFQNLNPLGKTPELSIFVEEPIRSGEWKKVEEWKATSSSKSNTTTSTSSPHSVEGSESDSLISVLMKDFWNERLKLSGYTHLTIRNSKDGPPGAPRRRTTSTASSSSLTSRFKRRDGSNMSQSSSRTFLASAASENEDVEFEPQPTGLERVGRHLSRLSVSLASLFGALDVAGRDSDLDPEDLGYVNVDNVSDEETDGQRSRSGLRRRIGKKIRRVNPPDSSIRENGSPSRAKTSRNQEPTGALGLLVQILPAPLLRISGLSRFKSSSRKVKKSARSRDLNSNGNGFASLQSEPESDVNTLSLHTSAGPQSDLETDLDEDARELDASEISSNSSKIRKLFKTPLTNASTSTFNSDTDGERSSVKSSSRRSFKGKKKQKDRSDPMSTDGGSDTDGSGWAGGDSKKQASVLRKAAMRKNHSQTSQSEDQTGGGFWKALLGTRLGVEAERRDSVDSLERGRKENLKQRKWKSPREIQTSKGRSGFNERLDIDSPDKLRFSRPLPPISSEGGKRSTSTNANSKDGSDDGQDAATIATSRALSSYEALTSSTPSTIKGSSINKKTELPDLTLSQFGKGSSSTKSSVSPTSGSSRSKRTIEVDEDPFARSQPSSIIGRFNSSSSNSNDETPSQPFQMQVPSTPNNLPALKRTASLETVTPTPQDSGFAGGDKKTGKSKPSAWRFKANKEADGYASAGEYASVPPSPSGGSLLRLGRSRRNSSSSSLDLGKVRRSSFSKTKEQQEKEDAHFKGATVISRPEDAGMRWGGGEEEKVKENVVKKKRMVLD